MVYLHNSIFNSILHHQVAFSNITDDVTEIYKQLIRHTDLQMHRRKFFSIKYTRAVIVMQSSGRFYVPPNVCAYHCAQLSYTTQQGSGNFSLVLQTIVIAQTMSTGGRGVQQLTRHVTYMCCWYYTRSETVKTVETNTNPRVIDVIGLLLCYCDHVCWEVNGSHEHVMFLTPLNIQHLFTDLLWNDNDRSFHSLT